MMGWEFVFVLVWLLLPPLVLASVALVLLLRRRTHRTVHRTLGAVTILVVVSFVLAFAFVAWAPPGLGPGLGMRDEPVMWAPFAFIAVAFAFPVAAWWAFGRQPVR
jgi:ATP/ADP translocase